MQLFRELELLTRNYWMQTWKRIDSIFTRPFSQTEKMEVQWDSVYCFVNYFLSKTNFRTSFTSYFHFPDLQNHRIWQCEIPIGEDYLKTFLNDLTANDLENYANWGRDLHFELLHL
jgi:hypothetical protein